MDWLEEQGALALGSRLKRLGDTFVSEVIKVYQDHGIELNPRFFPLISLLAEKRPLPITEIAERLGITHAAVSQMSRYLEDDGWISSAASTADERKRVLKLTKKGEKKVNELQPLWKKIRNSVNGILLETDNNLLESIGKIEKTLKKKPLHHRIKENNLSIDGLQISGWDPAYKRAFYDLNAEWINYYFQMEEADEKSIGDPEKYYIKRGGEIFFAKLSGAIVGTCAIVETSPGSFELSKMAVSQVVQGRGVAKALLIDVIEKLRRKDATEIWLETASCLKTAIALYKKLGFKIEDHPKGGSHYKRADVYMRLMLK